MIVELYVSHYKSIFEDTIHLGKTNLLVGKNGSGKSNIVDAIAFLADVANDDLDYAITKRHGADSVRQWSKFKPYHTTIAVKLSNDYGDGTYKLSFSSSRNGYRITEEHFFWAGLTYYGEIGPFTSQLTRTQSGTIELSTDYSEYDEEGDPSPYSSSEAENLRSESGDSILYKLSTRYTDLSDVFGYIFTEIKSFALFSIFPNTIMSPQSVSRASQLETDGKNIASIIKQMGASRRNKDRLIRSLKGVLPQLQNIVIKSAAGYYVPVFVVADPGEEPHELNMSQISDGTLRMLGILTAIHQPQAPTKIALEEPEQMVHPALLAIVRDAAIEFVSGPRKNRQIFLTTHSAALMDLFDVEDIIVVEYSRGSTRSGRISERQREIVKSGLMTLGDLVVAEDLELA